MMRFDTPLPIDAVLPEISSTLDDRSNAVLVAPPGAGKTTRVPLALLDARWRGDGKIIVLEPRRVAARAAASRMAAAFAETVGETVGLRARLDTRISRKTRIEVVTEGVFTRMILADPMLEGIAAILFDEFHERSLDADLGLALALDAQALRNDLRILVMSATLDGARIGALLHPDAAPVILSDGRSFPVETRYVGRKANDRIEDQIADVVSRAVRAEPGSVLAFLPGQAEIHRVGERLATRLTTANVDIAPLYGAMDGASQDAAVRPARAGRRKIVLATSIAETSLTIEGVRIVVDSGLARVPRYEPDVGVTRLETVRVSRASADQRRGRAGRTEAGVCYRLWDEPQTQSLPAFTRPEILDADLSGLLLDLAEWGVTDHLSLRWLDPPPEPAMREARTLLTSLGAIDADGRITTAGKSLRSLPLSPRLGAMIIGAVAHGAEADAAAIAALLTDRGLGASDIDLDVRLAAFRRQHGKKADDMRRMAAGWAATARRNRKAEDAREHSAAFLLSLAYPERVAKARGAPGQFLLANGRAATIDPVHRLAAAPFIVVGDLSGTAANARILTAAAIEQAEVEARYAARIRTVEEVRYDPAAKALRARRLRMLDAITLQADPLPAPPSMANALLLAEGIARHHFQLLPFSKAMKQWRDRIAFLRAAQGAEWPDLSNDALRSSVTEWLAPHLPGTSSLEAISSERITTALLALLSWDMQRRLDAEAPTHFLAPTGNSHAIDYQSEGAPVLAIRVQELFGLREHPAIARGRLPLTLHLLSPAHRPIQITRDLPGFWKGSWASVKADMRGRYPRHSWPDDPADAAPTARAKPRGT